MRLFDTTFIVDLANSDSGALRLARKVDDEASLAAISVISVHEYLFGVHHRYHEEKGTLNQKLIAARSDLQRFEVLPLTTEVAEVSSDIHAELIRKGRQVGINDVYIAATAARYGMTLVTRNRDHFGRIPKVTVEHY